MNVLIVGAGVVGVTAAWALVRRGHQVTVVDRLEGAALETSLANAGQRSYGYVYPWAAAGMVGTALRGLLSRYGPLKITTPWSPRTLEFLAMTARYSLSQRHYAVSHAAMLELGEYSRQCFLALEEPPARKFDGQHDGLMEVAGNQAACSALRTKARTLEKLGIEHEWLSAAAVRQREPGMQGSGTLVGGLRLPHDGTGDCHRFTRALARACERQGVHFQYRTAIRDWDLEGRRIRGAWLQSLPEHPGGSAKDEPSGHYLETGQVVLCAGCASRDLARPLGLNLPIYPVKGYSLTSDLEDPSKAPRSTVVDHGYKVAITRLGKRVRVTGFVELDSFQRKIPTRRLQVLREGFASRFPGAADLGRAEAWTGFRPMTPDGPPILGWGHQENLLLNTGHGTFGWTLSAGCGEIIGQLLDGETPAMGLAAFRPDRFT
ncbi:D-amino-acid dehydrogenase [Marinobacter daqiaonensis]|uniref:D-amino-acid dehydrogenase n=1 Tax=Marinobacter daqiaonensis TaxID=650891 RepID=A0A1I6GJK8_9GAMM|nr:D-amino acid dehydrogenase [Marinobacter daqiaonensis]SFR42321.1 D-amino-acid dehydrogenase [Marinobacter daqiaonensis]